jgi:DNA polymerase (family X)
MMSNGRDSAALAPPGTGLANPALGNEVVARRLEEVARILEIQNADGYRVRAWRAGASRVRGLDRSVARILHEEGIEGLERLPDIGPVMSRAIQSIVVTGRLSMLERLRGEMEPDRLLASVPGIGRELARRLHHELDISTLEDLEAAAHSGRLAAVEGFGTKRVAGILDTLASRLNRASFPRPATNDAPVSELLDVDAEYRRRAAAGDLKRISPRRFNPKHEAWLPVLHTRRGDREFTALYSNTARAHEVGRTGDWVVIYHDGPGGESRATVVTVRGGALAGERVVRGREAECARFYAEGERGEAPLAETILPGAADPTSWEKAGRLFESGRRGGTDAVQ